MNKCDEKLDNVNELEIHVVMGDINYNIEKMGKKLQILRERLYPILNKHVPEETSELKSKELNSDFGTHLNKHNTDISIYNEIIDDVLSRLEI